MKNIFLLAITFFAFNSHFASAEVIFYQDLASFENVFPNLEEENFDAIVAPDSGATDCSISVSSLTDDDCVDPGDILTGITFTTFNSNDLVALGVNFLGLPSKVIGPNISIDGLRIDFNPPVRAIAFDQLTFGSPATDTPNLKIYDESDAVILNMDTSSSLAGDFTGFSSDVAISAIEIFSVANKPELVDNIRFKEFTEADINVFTDEAFFDNRYPDFTLEDFEESKVTNNTGIGCSNLLNYHTNDNCFSTGNIARGVVITTNTNGDLFAGDIGYFGLPSKMVGPNNPIQGLVITFDPPVRALGMMQHTLNFSEPDVQNVVLRDVNDVELLNMDTNVTTAGNFFGFESRVDVKTIEILSAANKAEIIDNLRFEKVEEDQCFVIKSSNSNIAVVCL